MERVSRGPRYSQSLTGIPTEVDQGNRASLVRQDLPDRLARYFLSKLAALHGVLLLSRDEPSLAKCEPLSYPARLGTLPRRLNLVRMRYGEQQGQVLVGLNAVFVCRTAMPASDSRDFGLDPPGLCQPWSGASWHTHRRGRHRAARGRTGRQRHTRTEDAVRGEKGESRRRAENGGSRPEKCRWDCGWRTGIDEFTKVCVEQWWRALHHQRLKGPG